MGPNPPVMNNGHILSAYHGPPILSESEKQQRASERVIASSPILLLLRNLFGGGGANNGQNPFGKGRQGGGGSKTIIEKTDENEKESDGKYGPGGEDYFKLNSDKNDVEFPDPEPNPSQQMNDFIQSEGANDTGEVP
jgi:hypothetical protein